MTNKTISALSSASTIVGTEVLPIVQSSATVKVSVANLTSGLGTIIATKGGTGQTSYSVGDIIYADTTTTLAKLPDVATGNALISGGVTTAPSWGKIGLTTHVSGVLPVANGGTNASTASITSFNNITGYSASGATGTTSTNLVFSTSPTITTPSITGDATLSTGNVVISTLNKGVTATGGAFVSTSGVVSAAGTLDLAINAAGFVGTFSVSATRYNYTPQSTRTVYAMACYGSTMTSTQLHTQNGSGGGSAFTLTIPSAGTVRFTDTSGSGSAIVVYLAFHGAYSYG